MPATQRSLAMLCASIALPATLSAQFNLDWRPAAAEVVLNTKSTTITPVGGAPVVVKNGVFMLRNVTIPANVTVRGVGPNPLIFVVAGKMQIDGRLIANGGTATDSVALRAANNPSPGGRGVCGGGNGGAGSPVTNDRSFVGQTGFGPWQTLPIGGRGGRLFCSGPCQVGSGGGGGSFTTQGDPYYKFKSSGQTGFVQQRGRGGYGCTGPSGRPPTLPGGPAGSVLFFDKNPGNNFFGIAFDVNRKTFIQGELPFLVGGTGGGGGGDWARSCASKDRLFINDERGGGGGGGGGVIVVLAQGSIVVSGTGQVQCNGGNGGGGAWAGSNNRSGGGGGGAGGALVLYSRTNIDITVKGETYAKNNYDFALSADGGIGRTVSFSGGITNKYPPVSGNIYDGRPAGGFDGLGLIQLAAPVDLKNADKTNTILDDNIILRDAQGRILTGATKQRFLAWRGFPDRNGVWVDDSGKPTSIGDEAGDIRPTPILIPALW